jgi:hypothetical protein
MWKLLTVRQQRQQRQHKILASWLLHVLPAAPNAWPGYGTGYGLWVVSVTMWKLLLVRKQQHNFPCCTGFLALASLFIQCGVSACCW